MKRGRYRGAVVACLFARAVSLPRPALAQDIVAAEALFREGRALLEQGSYDEACRKLAESERLDASSGTALNLASCHEHQGKLATAWAEYLLASRLARTQGNADRVAEAKARASDLEPRLSTLTIHAAEVLPGLEIRRDDAVLEASSVGSKIPVDPGLHRVVVSAPGHESVTLEVTVGEKADARVVTLPKLKAVAAEPAPGVSKAERAESPAMQKPVPTAAQAVPHRQNQTPFIVGRIGAALAVTGGVFGVVALTTYHSANQQCPSHVGCTADAVATRDRAGVFATVANVGVGLGLVGIGTAVAMWLTGGDSPRPSTHGTARPTVSPEFGPGIAAVTVAGAFE